MNESAGPPVYDPSLPPFYIGVHGIWRCEGCLRALWLTGHPVENCADEKCGIDVPPLTDAQQEYARQLGEEIAAKEQDQC